MTNKHFLALCAATFLVTASGCTFDQLPLTNPTQQHPNPSTELMLKRSRDFQHRTLIELMEFLPDEHIIDKRGEPTARSRVLFCDWYRDNNSSSRAGVFLPGGSKTLVTPETNIPEILQQIYAHYSAEPDWQVSWHTPSTESLERSLDLVSPGDYAFYLSHSDNADGTITFRIMSFSPCFEAYDGFDHFADY